MTAFAWWCLALCLFPIPFLFRMGVHPLLVDRRLRRIGVKTDGVCRGVSRSEDRYSTSFQFHDAEGYPTIYISSLRAGPLAHEGDGVTIVYDPKSPDSRARCESELCERSEAWHSLWVLAAIELLFLVITAAVLIQQGVLA
ncbi:hypothetical protein [Streptomyces sp. NPDC101150]|uniref:hypothetical protein n=1 Tax=Streptomyces sp. NPDC101150 TaxID=3366114 RepID=UPI0038073FAC